MKSLAPNLVLMLLVAAAVAVVEWQLPVLQVLALVVLVVVPGAALESLLIDIGGSTTHPRSAFRRVAEAGNGFISYPLSVLLGMVMVALAALVLHGLSIRLEPTSLAAALALTSIFLLVFVSSKGRVFRLPRIRNLPAVLKPALAVAALGLAVAGAVAMAPTPDEEYAVLAFPDARIGVDGLSAPAGSTMTVPWTLGRFGDTHGVEQFEVSLNETPTEILGATSNPVAAQRIRGATFERAGTVSFRTPDAPGSYRLRIALHGHPSVGPDDVDPVFLNATLEVHA